MSGAQQEAPVRYRYYAAAPGALTSPWLVVGGFGVAVENMGAPTLWQGMKKAAGGYVANPDAPFNSLRDCQDMADTFRGAVLRRTLRHWATDGETLKHFVENYPIPTCVSLPGRKERSVEFQVLANESNRRVQYALQNIAGMAFHEIGHIDTRATHVDLQLAWRTVMSRFDGAGDLNCQLLYAEDGYAMRSRPGGWEPPQPVGPRGVLARPKSASDLSESFASVLLMRPAAAQWLAELAPHTIDSRPVKTLSNGMRIVGRHGFGGIHNETVWFGRNGYRPPHS